MQAIFSYLQDYFRMVDKWILGGTALFTALLIILNYRLGIENKWIYGLNHPVQRFLGFYCVYAISYLVPFTAVVLLAHRAAAVQPACWLLALAAPALFAMKASFNPMSLWQPITSLGRYFSIIGNLPSRLLLLLVPLSLFWYWLQSNNASFWGLTTRGFHWQPYVMMLLIMLPLIAFASTQQDFLHTYPKLKQVAFTYGLSQHPIWYKLGFELSYGTDFLTIELFFRGFLVFAFVRWLGPDAILPMAAFYCSIHFGKPLFECISSFFGGLLLGIIAYRTQSILGGIVVHLGIAWMMEAGGYIGNLLKK
jgi:membrane protease YdiL (CAAX protease family)